MLILADWKGPTSKTWSYDTCPLTIHKTCGTEKNYEQCVNSCKTKCTKLPNCNAFSIGRGIKHQYTCELVNCATAHISEPTLKSKSKGYYISRGT